jgi:hypothetical protein
MARDKSGRDGYSLSMMGRALRQGLVAGTVGAAVMTVGEKIEQRLTGRPDSHVPGQVLERLIGLPERPGRVITEDGLRNRARFATCEAGSRGNSRGCSPPSLAMTISTSRHPEEELVLLDALQQLSRVVLPGESVAQRCTQPLENGTARSLCSGNSDDTA